MQAAYWPVGKLLTKLSDDSVAAYVASLELGPNSGQIKEAVMYMHGLLHAAQGRDLSNPGLEQLLQELGKKADAAEDVLDELHYFMIRDQLDATHWAAPDLGSGFPGHAHHGGHAALHVIGNWLSCFSCSPIPTQDDDDCALVSGVTSKSRKTTKGDGGYIVHDLKFERVVMSNKIKSVLEDIKTTCAYVSGLLSQNNSIKTTAATLKRHPRGSTISITKLHGRSVILEQTISGITSDKSQGETLSVLPIVGPGGIGKTTFAQHLYNHTRSEQHFAVRVWVCVSTDFDVLRLTNQILSSINATEKEGSNNITNEATNLDQPQKSIAWKLKSKRFLIVLDDIWECDHEEWETLLGPFKNAGAKGSMVLVTTRFPKLAYIMKTIDPIELQGLEANDFITFFEECIFGEHNKPDNYEDDLSGIAREIAKKLKGSPLAAKTVGRLLKKNLSREHWKGVLQKHKWLKQEKNSDIMPSLKISYDYLPFDLKKCFSYCALFPEDHRFNNSQMNFFWIAIGIIDLNHEGNSNYLEELVENGFLMKETYYNGNFCYVMHDLMHELSQSVSSQECLNISSLDFRTNTVAQSIRHLSITINNKYDKRFREEMCKLKGMIDIVNLRTLMIFGQFEENCDIIKHTFNEISGLRILVLSVSFLKFLPHNFTKLIHLRYLKIRRSHDYTNSRRRIFSGPGDGKNLTSTLPRFYHLQFLDLEDWQHSINVPKNFSRLVNLRCLLANQELHSNIPEVGRMKYLEELKEFHVKKETVGFELKELGKLTELGGQLNICNLETVESKEEASAAKLMSKENLEVLTLGWGGEQPAKSYANVLDGLRPNSYLRALTITNPGGDTGPGWLFIDLSLNNLEILCLESVSWKFLPPFGELPHLKELSLKNIRRVIQLGPEYGGVKGKCFKYLKTIRFASMPELVEWAVEPNSLFFTKLHSMELTDCPNLCKIPFSEYSCANLFSLEIYDCPKLCLPPMPHTSTLKYLVFNGTLNCHGKLLDISGYHGALAFHNMNEVERVILKDVLHISVTDMENLTSLTDLEVGRCDGLFPEVLDCNIVLSKVQNLVLHACNLIGKLLSKVLKYFPALSVLKIYANDEYESYGELVMEFPSSSSLQRLTFSDCSRLFLVPAENGGGIHEDNSSLQTVTISSCGNLFRRWPKGDVGGSLSRRLSRWPFPAALRELDVDGERSMESMALLSNLTSLACLRLVNCYALRVDGFNPLITANLKELGVYNTKWDRNGPSIGADLISDVARTKGSYKLQVLKVDNISRVLVAPICNLLIASLHELSFEHDNRTGWFTQEQERALQLLTSLQKLQFNHCNLLSIPQGLRSLSSLKELHVDGCSRIQLISTEDFPLSLRVLSIDPCSIQVEEQLKELERTNPDLHVAPRSRPYTPGLLSYVVQK